MQSRKRYHSLQLACARDTKRQTEWMSYLRRVTFKTDHAQLENSHHRMRLYRALWQILGKWIDVRKYIKVRLPTERINAHISNPYHTFGITLSYSLVHRSHRTSYRLIYNGLHQTFDSSRRKRFGESTWWNRNEEHEKLPQIHISDTGITSTNSYEHSSPRVLPWQDLP